MAKLTRVTLCFAILVALYSSAHGIKCYVCDPLKDNDCLTNKTIDCSADRELGHAFDSCYTLQMVITDFSGVNFTYEEKNCSIQYGCSDLRRSMCVQFNETTSGAVKSCNIDCCSNDLCNYGEIDFTKERSTRPTPTEEVEVEVDATTGPVVLARKYSSAARSYFSWLCMAMVFISLYSCI